MVKDLLSYDGPETPKPKVPVGILDSGYARDKQQMMSTMNDVRSTGVSVDVDLPVIVVAGNQSSGKSSVIEAISGIKLPRAAGTCTRVPIEVRLTQKTEMEWQCVVKIRRETSEQGQDLPEGQKPEVPFGPTLFDPDQVEATIRRAQLAILNPSVPYEQFIDYEIPDQEVKRPLGSAKQYQFSRNVVVIEITGPAVTDLTLVDLPGIIQNVAPGEDADNPKLVESLVKHYIQKDCLILLVITMKDDMQNQRAWTLATEADPKHTRTIGVLTKVDTLKGVEVDYWMGVLKGRTYPLAHGYYVTLQPDADALLRGTSFEAARAAESDFFANTPAWKGLEKGYINRLGTNNLTTSLSDQLLLFIQKKLPTLITHIDARYQSTLKEIQDLGAEPSDDPAFEMMNLISDFVAGIEADIQGHRQHEVLMQQMRGFFEGFKKDVWATAPRFAPFVQSDVDAIAGVDTDGLENTDENDNLGLYDDGDSNADYGDAAGGIPEIKAEGFADVASTGDIMHLDEMRNRIGRSLTRELHGNVPWSVKAQLIQEYTSTWGRLASELLEVVRPALEALLESTVLQIFGRYKETLLPEHISSLVGEKVSALAVSTDKSIAKLISHEERPFTMNDYCYDDLTGKILAQLREQRHPPTEIKDLETHNKHMRAILASLPHVGFQGTNEDDLAKLRPTDGYETELKVMAEIRAYWQVAYRRLIDNIPRLIDAEFIVPVAKVLRGALLEDMKISSVEGQERCRAFLGETATQQKIRKLLKDQKTRLQNAKKALKNLRSRPAIASK